MILVERVGIRTCLAQKRLLGEGEKGKEDGAAVKEAVRRQWRAVAVTATELRAAIAKKAARMMSVEEVEAADTARRVRHQHSRARASAAVAQNSSA